MVEEEVDSAAGRRLLPRRALQAQAVLGARVITPKHIINYHSPLTRARIKGDWRWTLNVERLKKK